MGRQRLSRLPVQRLVLFVVCVALAAVAGRAAGSGRSHTLRHSASTAAAPTRHSRAEGGGRAPDSATTHTCIHEKVQAATMKASSGVFGHVAAPPRKRGTLAKKEEPGLPPRRTQDSERQPLRIVFDVMVESGSGASATVTAEELEHLERMLPEAAQFWADALSVDRVEGPLYAHRPCRFGYNDGTCDTYDQEPVCGADPETSPVIPAKYFGEQEACDGAQSDPLRSCTTEPAGEGMPDADVVAFVTAVQTDLCGPASGQGGTVAYASWCQTDDVDRPTWGHINVCPAALDTDEEDYDSQLAVLLHELGHMLGFTSASIPLFRRRNGTPRTPRSSDPFSSYRVADEHVLDVHCPSDSDGVRETAIGSTVTTLDFSSVRGHSSCDPERPGTCVVSLTTPAVREVAKKWFGCSELIGAELEDNPSSPCSPVASHWEQRIFMNELMASTLSHSTIVSPLTLAFFEDTGWYTADYTIAAPARQGFDFGYKQGCDFVQEKCITSQGAGGDPPHFCLDTSRYHCTVDRQSTGHCLRGDLQQTLPTMYRYFEDPEEGSPSVDADHCPMVAGFSNGLCGDARNAPTVNVVGETYGEHSMCHDTTAVWQGATVDNVWVGCFHVQCVSAAAAQIRLENQDGDFVYVTCNATEGDTFGTLKQPADFDGSIACLDVASLCGAAEIPTPDSLIYVEGGEFAEVVDPNANADDDAVASSGSGSGTNGDGDGPTSLVGQLVAALGVDESIVYGAGGGLVIVIALVTACLCCRGEKESVNPSHHQGVRPQAAPQGAHVPPMSQADRMFYEQQAAVQQHHQQGGR